MVCLVVQSCSLYVDRRLCCLDYCHVNEPVVQAKRRRPQHQMLESTMTEYILKINVSDLSLAKMVVVMWRRGVSFRIDICR